MNSDTSPIPVIDLFAGPGGLAEGFTALVDELGHRCFRIALSIEKEQYAHRTLELRTFFREFTEQVPPEYYDYLKGEIARDELFSKYPEKASTAKTIAWHAELSSPDYPPSMVDRRICEAIGDSDKWVLIGGPPCQAYSVIGRARIRGRHPEKYENDPRHYLYKEYLRILAEHRPPVFIMENVPGIISTNLNGENIFDRILTDLESPLDSIPEARSAAQSKDLGYRLYSLSKQNTHDATRPEDFLISMKHYGVPQDRRRVIVVGVRGDIEQSPEVLSKHKGIVTVGHVIGGLPRIRSALSADKMSKSAWKKAIRSINTSKWIGDSTIGAELRSRILSCSRYTRQHRDTGSQYVRGFRRPRYRPDWYCNVSLDGVCNHSSKSHMIDDLHRYMYAACFAQVYKRSPRLSDFPRLLLPKHRNAETAVRSGRLFIDRFRVQLRDMPATTITSHIAKDGHYFIHPDPLQCRSLTVREAARLQTFPDDYFFEGPKTSQYQQVGNAVPPLLAHQIAAVVDRLLTSIKS